MAVALVSHDSISYKKLLRVCDAGGVVLEEYLDSPVTREARVAEGAHLPTDHDRGFNLVDVAGRGYWTFVSYPPRSAPRCFDLQERLAVPIVFISAHDDGPTLERVEKSRAAGHLRDPFDTATVLETIRRAARSIQGR